MIAAPWLSLTEPVAEPPASLVGVDERSLTSVNASQNLIVGTAPNGTNDALQLEVPEGDAVNRVGLRIEPSMLARSESVTWSGPQHWNQSGVVLQGIDANQSSMTLLPQGFEYDFENNAIPSSFTKSGHSNWYTQSGTRLSGQYTARSGSISHNQWTAISVPVSNMVGTLSFKYRTSSESNYDFLLFCVDNTGCSRYSGYTARWSGYNTAGTFNHNIQAGSHTYTWKYYKDGSVNSGSDCAFVDDIEFMPSSGSANGQANWTSPIFGPGASGSLATTPGPYGHVSIDAKTPSGSLITTSILDGASGNEIPGYEGLTGSSFDLGGIDPDLHSTLRMRLDLVTTGALPQIHGIHLNGRIATSLESNPVNDGWSWSGMSWDGDSIHGNGIIQSPTFASARPIARITTAMSISGSTDVAVSVDGGGEQAIPSQGSLVLERPGRTFSFKLGNSTSTSFDLQSFRIDLDPGAGAVDPAIDIGKDGVDEWSLANPTLGAFGMQDRFSSGDRSVVLRWPTPANHSVPVLVPAMGVDAMDWLMVPGANPPGSVKWSVGIGGSEIANGSVTLTDAPVRVSLNETVVEAMATLARNATPSLIQDGLSHVRATITIEGQQGEAILSGLLVRSEPKVELDLGPGSSLVLAANDMMPTSTLTGSTRYVPVSFRLAVAGAIKATITNLETSSDMTTDRIEIRNATSTLAPSYQWIEVESHHNISDGLPARVQLDVAGLRNSATIEVDLNLDIHQVQQTGPANGSLIHLHPDHPFDHTTIDGHVNSTIRFRLDGGWDDEEQVWLKSRLIADDGRRSVPEQQLFGIGQRLGIENDVEIREWSISNDLGVEIPASMSYLKAAAPVKVSVLLGFPELDESLAPRSGDVAVRLFETRVPAKEVLLANSSSLDAGWANFEFNTPGGTGDVVYRIDVWSNHDAENLSSIVLNRTFVVDSFVPELISRNVADHDHLEPRADQRLRFEVFDRPILPTAVSLNLWRDWIDDDDQDGNVSADEYRQYSLTLPSNLSAQQGNYTVEIDDSLSPDGGLVHGWLDVSDPAGNRLAGGTWDDPLFIYQLKRDGAPLLSGEGGFVDGDHGWLHPSIGYEMRIPVFEPNGVSDIDRVVLELASNSAVDRLPVIWNGSSAKCETTSNHIVDLDCDVVSRSGDLDPFSTDLDLEVQFGLDWSLPVESELRREPSLEVVDRAGQSAWITLPGLRWRFSPDLAIDTDTLSLDPLDGTLSHNGAWVTPGSDIIVNGTVVFPDSGDVPTLPHTVAVLFAGNQQLVESDEQGRWEVILRAPASSGELPLDVELLDLPPQARDLTDHDGTRRWIRVDGTAPKPDQVLAPRAGREIPVASLENLSIEIGIRELQEVDPSSLSLNWRLSRRDGSGLPYANGDAPLLIPGGAVAGQSLLSRAVVPISAGLPPTVFAEELRLEVWVTGQDRAGNPMASSEGFNSESNPFAKWNIERLAPDFSIDEDGVSYSRTGSISPGQMVMISVEISNEGDAHGWGNLSLVEERPDGTTVTITSVPMEFDIAPGGRKTVNIDWEPKSEGHVSVVAVVDGETLGTGDRIEVVTADSESASALFGSTPPVMIAVFAVLIAILIGVILLAIRTTGEADDWDDELWDDMEQSDEVLRDDARGSASAAQASAAAALGARHQAPAKPVPHADPYVQQLIDQGYSPAVAEQHAAAVRARTMGTVQVAAPAPGSAAASPLPGVDAATYQQWISMGWSHEQIAAWWQSQQQGR